MSDTAITAIVVAFFACIPPSLVAWAALRSSKVNTAKADVLTAKADAIHVLANDNLSRATNALAVANETIKGLQLTLAAMVERDKKNDLPPQPPAA